MDLKPHVGANWESSHEPQLLERGMDIPMLSMKLVALPGISRAGLLTGPWTWIWRKNERKNVGVLYFCIITKKISLSCTTTQRLIYLHSIVRPASSSLFCTYKYILLLCCIKNDFRVIFGDLLSHGLAIQDRGISTKNELRSNQLFYLS